MRVVGHFLGAHEQDEDGRRGHGRDGHEAGRDAFLEHREALKADVEVRRGGQEAVPGPEVRDADDEEGCIFEDVDCGRRHLCVYCVCLVPNRVRTRKREQDAKGVW